MNNPMDNSNLVLLEKTLLPTGFKIVKQIFNQVDWIRLGLNLEVEATEDGGAIIIFEDKVTSRELTFAIPNDGSYTLFTAIAPKQSYRLNGLVNHEHTIDSLAHWVTGEKP